MKFLNGEGGGETFLERSREARLRKRPMGRKDHARDTQSDDHADSDGKNDSVAIHDSGLAILNGGGDRGLGIPRRFEIESSSFRSDWRRGGKN